jgi:hypothetical protein
VELLTGQGGDLAAAAWNPMAATTPRAQLLDKRQREGERVRFLCWIGQGHGIRRASRSTEEKEKHCTMTKNGEGEKK